MYKKGKLLSKIVSAALSAAMLLTAAVPFTVGAVQPSAEPTTIDGKQVIVLKLDDIREGTGVRDALKRVKAFIDEKGIKASFGVIGVSLEDDGKKEDYYEDIQSFVADGNIEIWHHGYYHDKANRVEFSGGTYDEQYKQLKDTIDLMQDKCGITLRTFGPPYNATDKVTIEALNNLPQMKVFFFPSVTEGGTQLMLRESGNLETDTGVVDYDKFVETYESSKKDKPYLVLQGHPGNFSDQSFENFKKIVEYLMAKNTVFMTPTEYYNKLNGVSSVFPENGKYNQADNPGDYSVALTLNGNTLASVSNGGKELVKDTDYTLAGDTVVLKSDYLMALEPAAYDFTFRFSAKDDAKLSLKVIDPSKEPIKVIIDDEPVTFDVEPITINDRTMVPFRAIFEKFGAEVTWDGETNTAGGKLDETTVSLPIDSTTAYVNGKPVELDVPATVIDDRTLVPLRFISENFGATVKWYEETRTAKIVSGPTNTILKDGEFKGGGLKVVSTKSVLKNYKKELFTVDGQIVPDDRWDAEGKGSWIQYELDDVYSIDSVALSWFKGDQRKSKFEIAVSENGIDYVTAFSGESGGTTDQLEKYTFTPVKGKYVRVIGNGNDSASSYGWNSLLEVEIYGAK